MENIQFLLYLRKSGVISTELCFSHCRHLIPMGYTLAVTLEIADATLGGLAFGVGMTTYSHKVRSEGGVSAIVD